MAIFPEYAMPKYKSPIRINKPYIKPNYIADAIIGGMGAYTNMQGMNLKKQMFGAQMAQQQRAIAEKNAEQAAIRDLINNAPIDGTPAGIPKQYMGPLGAGPMMAEGSPAIPGPMDSIKEAMLNNPGVNPTALMQSLARMQGLQPTPPTVSRADLRYRASQQDRFNRTVSKHMTDVFGDLLQGEAAALTARFPGTDKMLQSNPIKTENQFLSGKSLLDAKLSDIQFLPNWDTGGEENPGYLASQPNPNYQESGEIGFRSFLEEKIKPMVQQMILDKKSPGEIQIALRRIKQQAMGTEGKDVFNYNSIAQMLNQNRGMLSTADANAIITGQ